MLMYIYLFHVCTGTYVSSLLPGRTGKQCRERWLNHLSDGIKKGEWSEEEDRRITTMRLAIGNQWSKVSLEYQFTSISNYYSCICKVICAITLGTSINYYTRLPSLILYLHYLLIIYI